MTVVTRLSEGWCPIDGHGPLRRGSDRGYCYRCDCCYRWEVSQFLDRLTVIFWDYMPDDRLLRLLDTAEGLSSARPDVQKAMVQVLLERLRARFAMTRRQYIDQIERGASGQVRPVDDEGRFL